MMLGFDPSTGEALARANEAKKKRSFFMGEERLNVADGDGFAEAFERVTGGDPFVPDVAGVVDFEESLHEAAVVDFLVIANLATSRVSGDLDVANEFVMLLDSADEITVHDLDVVGIEEDFEVG